MSHLIGYTIPQGRAVKRVEDKSEWLATIKKSWKTIEYAIEDIEVPDDLDGEELLNFVNDVDKHEIITRDELIELRMI